MTVANGSGKIITFYSYKGGTGRSMALANVAWVLASKGRRVLAVDWDLEAPGLHRYFYPFLVDKELTGSDGVVDLMNKFWDAAMTLPEAGETPEKDWYKPHANILRYVAPLDWEFPDDGRLDFIPAGRQDDFYSSRVTSFNWQRFYDDLGGGVFLEAVKERMRAEYDYILIDSRTGVSDASGICTVQMPDALVVCFTLNNQSIEGAASVANSVYEQRRNTEPAIQVFPVPMRIENGEKEKLERRREYAKKQFEPFPTHVPHEKRDDYWGQVEVMYVPYYAYEEILAPFGDKRGQTVSLLAAVERLTSYLTQGDPQGEIKNLATPPEEADRQRVLREYARDFSEAIPTTDEQLQALDEAQANAAEAMFASFTPEQQALARRVFSRLVRVAPPEEVGGDTRVRVKKTDLGTAAKPILDELLYQKFVLLGAEEGTDEETLELADDALLQKWERLRDWLSEDREFLLWRQGLQLGIAKWESTKRDDAALLHGAFLTEAEHYLATRTEALTDDESEFIAKSTEAESLRRQAENELRQKEVEARLETVKVRGEKRRLGLKWATLTAVLLLALAAFYQFIFYRERALTYLKWSPRHYADSWSDEFRLKSNSDPDASLWNYPKGSWTIKKGEGEANDDGALVVTGSDIGISTIGPAALYDFSADFKIRIVSGSRAAWVFRAQADRQRGYVFVLERDLENRKLRLNGYVYTGKGHIEPLDNNGAREIPFRGCCNWDDAFRIQAEVKGNEFRYWVTVESSFNPGTRKSKESPWLLHVDDLQGGTVLARKLRDGSDSVSEYLRTRFTEQTQQLLKNYQVNGALSETLRKALTEEFNNLLKGPSLFKIESFTKVIRTDTIQLLIEQEPKDQDLVRLNRLLLEAAYPVEIAKSEERLDTGVEYFIVPFRDDRSIFPYGNVGLFEPKDGDQMKIEYLRISAPPVKPPVNRPAVRPGE